MEKLEEFKIFVKDKPYLANKVKDGTFSWQTLYETYDLFGPEHDFFLDDSKKETTAKALKEASGFIRHELRERVEIRQIPELTFVYDDSINEAKKIENIIEKLHNE